MTPPEVEQLYHLLQFSDSTFPIGSFSFSNGLETASHLGIVHDAETLEQYTSTASQQAAFSDGVSALLAYRAAKHNDLAEIATIDRNLMLMKVNHEARIMICRMGKKMIETGIRLFPEHTLLLKWFKEMKSETTPGTYPVAQGIIFSICNLSEKALFASHQYGVINMILQSALRCLRVSHHQTQDILFRLSHRIPNLYSQASIMTIADIHSFSPEMDIIASIHEKGAMRMFMN